MRGMAPEDVYELTGAGEPRLSPDGTTVAYSVWGVDKERNDYSGAIWLSPVDGSRAPRQFTAGIKRDGTPRWSPDGTQIAFISNRDREQGQLYVMPVAGGEPRRLTDFKESVQEVAWSPNSSTLAF